MKPILLGMAVHGQWQVTKDCLDSIAQSHDPKYMDIFIVDNASPDSWDQSWENKWSAFVHRNDENLYCARAWNQIWRKAQPGQLVVIINNDIEVVTGFLHELHKTALLFSPSIATTHILGLASPEQQKPCIPGVVQILPPGHHHLSGVVFSGFRETFERVGGFDENYKTPWFEDNDFWMRCYEKGIPVLIAPTTVYHRGEITSLAVTFDRSANKRYFYETWKHRLGKEAEQELATCTDS